MKSRHRPITEHAPARPIRPAGERVLASEPPDPARGSGRSGRLTWIREGVSVRQVRSRSRAVSTSEGMNEATQAARP